jgi:hypothetical protein
MKTKYSMFLIAQKAKKKKLKQYCFAWVDNTNYLMRYRICNILPFLKRSIGK